MKTGDRPRRDTGVIDDWGDNDSPCLLALREGAKLGDDQPLDLVFGLWDFFHNTYGHYGGGRRTDTGVASIMSVAKAPSFKPEFFLDAGATNWIDKGAINTGA
jgi:hypothetical protein